jgi:FecR protein
MNTDRPVKPGPNPERDAIGELISRAGARPAPPDAARQAVLASVAEEWSAVVAERRRGHARRWMLAAVIALAAVGTSFYMATHWPHAGPLDAGTFLASQGRVEITRSGATAPIVSGDTIPAGARVTTAAEGRALFSVAGVSVRVGGGSDVTFKSPELVRLDKGLLYVDGGPHRIGSTSLAQQAIDVETSLGMVRHLGTQFEVAVNADRMRVRVREGMVGIQSTYTVGTLGASDELTIAASGEVTRTTVAPYGDSWAWTNDLSPAFPIEGRTFEEFLRWFGRETGRPVEFDAESSRLLAASTRLSGNIAGMRPDAALQAIAASTRFVCDLSDPSRVQVAVSPAGSPSAGNVKLRSDAEAPGPTLPVTKD